MSKKYNFNFMAEQRSSLDKELEEQRREIRRQELETASSFLADEERAAAEREIERISKERKQEPKIPGITHPIETLKESPAEWSVNELNESMQRGTEKVEELEEKLDKQIKGKTSFNAAMAIEDLDKVINSEE